jgi:excisionase family DNA binding protein
MMDRDTEQLAVRQEQAAKLLNMSVRTIQRLTSEYKIPHRRVNRNLVLYPVDALKKWVLGTWLQ